MCKLHGKGPCLAEGLKCNRLLVMTVVSDCEEYNEVLLALNSGAKNEKLPAELSLVVALPDALKS